MQPRSLPKAMVIPLVSKDPIALIPIGGQLEKEVVTYISIPIETREAPDELTPTSATLMLDRQGRPAAPVVDSAEGTGSWEKEIALNHVTDPSLRTRILQFLRKCANMWDGRLGVIKVTEHPIDLKLDLAPSHQMTYRQGLSMLEKTTQSLQA